MPVQFSAAIDWGAILDSLPNVAVSGIVSAAIYFIAASGLVVTYQTTGVFNMAHGATGMLSALLFWQLTQTTNVVDSPISFLSPELPAPLAAAIVVLLFAPLIGILVEVGIFRRLAGANLSTTLVVTVGLLAASLTIAGKLWPAGTRNQQPFFAKKTIDVFGTTITGHQILSMALAALVALGFWTLFRYSRLGVSMRAVVDNRALAALNGVPANRISMTSWALGSSLAGLAGVLTASLLPMEATALTLLVINAYAAAIFGKLKSLPLTFVGAVVLGVGEVFVQLNLGNFYAGEPIWERIARLQTVVPIIVLFIVLLVLPSERVTEKQPIGARLEQPPLPKRIGIAVIFVGIAWVFAQVFIGAESRSDLLTFGPALATGMVILSLVPLAGWGGQISLAQMAIAGVGAWIAALWGGNGSLLGLLGAIIVPALVGTIIAIPAIRLQGIYLALSTLAIAVFADKMFFTQEGVFYTGGLDVEVPKFGPILPSTPRAYFVYMAVMFALVGLLLAALKSGSLGRRIAAMRDAPMAAATLGMSTTRVKLVLFMIASAIAGLGGALLGGMRGSAGANDFEFTAAGLPILLLAVIGGISTVSGALVGGIFLVATTMFANEYPDFSWIVNLMPAVVGISMARNPDGAVPAILERIPLSSLGKRRSAAAASNSPKVPRPTTNPADEAEAAGIALGLEGVLANVGGR